MRLHKGIRGFELFYATAENDDVIGIGVICASCRWKDMAYELESDTELFRKAIMHDCE